MCLLQMFLGVYRFVVTELVATLWIDYYKRGKKGQLLMSI